MENESLVDRENYPITNEMIINNIEGGFLYSKFLKTIILLFFIFIFIIFAETNYLINEHNNILEYKSYHISEILENFYDSIELFFYKSKPRTKNDYIHSHLTIKEYFEKNHFVNSYINMSYFFDEFHFEDLNEISKDIEKNISENYDNYSEIINDISHSKSYDDYDNKINNEDKSNLEYRKLLDKKINEKINLYNISYFNDDLTNNRNDYPIDKNEKNKNNLDISFNLDKINSLKTNNLYRKYDSESTILPLSKQRKINKIKSKRNMIILNHDHSIENKISNTSYNLSIKTLSKIQLIKNLIEFERNSDINLLPYLKNNYRNANNFVNIYNSTNITKKIHINNISNKNRNEEEKERSYNDHSSSNLYFKDLTTNMLVESYLNYHKKKYEMYNNIDNLFRSFRKNSKIQYNTSLSDSEKIYLKKEYNKRLLNLLNLYDTKNNLERGEEFYFSYNKQLCKKFLYFYYLMNNLTSYDFKGNWKAFNSNAYFNNNYGRVDLEIKKNFSQLKNVNLNYNVFNTNENNLIDFFDYFRNLEFSFYAIDGKYKNNWMIFNFTVKFPENFIDFVEIFDKNKNVISIKNENVQVKYFFGELIEKKKKSFCKNSKVILEFIDKNQENNKSNNFSENKKFYFSNINNLKFSQLKGKIINQECGISLEFNLEANVVDVKEN